MTAGQLLCSAERYSLGLVGDSRKASRPSSARIALSTARSSACSLNGIAGCTESPPSLAKCPGKLSSKRATISAFMERRLVFADCSTCSRNSAGNRNLNCASSLLMGGIMNHGGVDSNGTTVI